MHLGSPHCLCFGYSWKNSESSSILESPLWWRSMHQVSACKERTLVFFNPILLYMPIFKPFTCSYAWLLIFITDQNRSMPYERQGFQSMCNHEFLQCIFVTLASYSVVFFSNSDPFTIFLLSLANKSFCGTCSAGLFSRDFFQTVDFVRPLYCPLIWNRN